MEIVGFALAIVMGFTLGLLGGGGSILTVPILVYVFGVEPVLATAYSLFVVGISSLVGTWRKHMAQQINWKIGFYFALPAVISIFLTRFYLVPAIPEVLFRLGDFVFDKNLALMVFFAVIMLLASISMIRGRQAPGEQETINPNMLIVLLEGVTVGLVTGLIGAGGGFIIVPALVLLVRLPIKTAIGTSLFIVTLNSLIGFSGDLLSGQQIDWAFLLLFSTFSIVGMFLGIYAARFANPEKLKKGFGYFVLVMGVFILLREATAKQSETPQPPVPEATVSGNE